MPLTKRKVQAKRANKKTDIALAGPEPVQVDADNLTRAYNWYNYVYDVDQAKTWIIDYMKANNYSKSDLSAVRRAPKHMTATTCGWIARILMNGNDLNQKTIEYFQSRIKQNIEAGGPKPDKEVEDSAPIINIQDRVREKANNIICDLEEIIDNAESEAFSMYKFCQKHELNAQLLGHIKTYYTPLLEEILSDDPQVAEDFGKKQKFWISFWTEFFNDIEKYLNNLKTSKVRKPRKKKEKTAFDLTKNVKYKKDDPKLKIVSVNPVEIIGCSQLWTYNSKYRKLTQYQALGPTGIQVKGTTLTGWDAESSVSKTLRTPEETLEQLLKAGKVTLRKFMSNLTTKPSSINGRVNADTILIRVVK